MTVQPDIVISSVDHRRLYELVDAAGNNPALERLADELDRAQILEPDAMPDNVVTMRSRVTFTLLDTGRTGTYTLVYPQEADGSGDKLSILTPVGSALLGLSVGQEIEWPINGKTTRVRIDAIAYQPERSGDLSA